MLLEDFQVVFKVAEFRSITAAFLPEKTYPICSGLKCLLLIN